MRIGSMKATNQLQYIKSMQLTHTSNTDDDIKEINRQIEQVQTQLITLARDKTMPVNEKLLKQKELEAKLQEYQKQIANLQMQKQQEYASKRESEIEDRKRKSSTLYMNDANGNTTVEGSRMKAVLKASSDLLQADKMAHMKKKLEVNSKIIEAGQKTETEKTLSTSEKRSEEVEKIAYIDKRLANIISNIEKEITRPISKEEKEQLKHEKERRKEDLAKQRVEKRIKQAKYESIRNNQEVVITPLEKRLEIEKEKKKINDIGEINTLVMTNTISQNSNLIKQESLDIVMKEDRLNDIDEISQSEYNPIDVYL